MAIDPCLGPPAGEANLIGQTESHNNVRCRHHRSLRTNRVRPSPTGDIVSHTGKKRRLFSTVALNEELADIGRLGTKARFTAAKIIAPHTEEAFVESERYDLRPALLEALTPSV